MPLTNTFFSVKTAQELLKKKDIIPHDIINTFWITPFFQVCCLEPNTLDEFQ